ncbi:glycoside hydrolase family 88 protein [Limibacter armeniacum]|uniref:glycoside hydrolase family 88 protein n=1 Tax=Limibacter armeniacum TaxID=466084 RepID=UPI002FE66A98
MQRIIFYLAVAAACTGCLNKQGQTVQEASAKTELSVDDQLISRSFTRAEAQLLRACDSLPEANAFPRSLTEDGALLAVSSGNWVSGFFPGSLWQLYQYKQDGQIKDQAIRWTEALEKEQFNTSTHDVGFILNCSFGNAYLATGNEQYKNILVQGAKSLLTRYNENVGSLKSWDWSDEWKFPVIADNMMNLELLFRATEYTGDSLYYNIAKTHALTTLKNHFREDNGSFHVVDYDPETGEVLEKVTHQGLNDSSTWARGEAWLLYGYTMCYRETGEEAFKSQAEKIATFVMENPAMPSDKIPYWDYNLESLEGQPRDASAAAINASALVELAKLVPEKRATYLAYAIDILTSLSSEKYLADKHAAHVFVLEHSTGNKPNDSEVDVPLAYADYYYLEALNRLSSLKQ